MPDGDYLRFRVLTQYGDAEHQPVPVDVLNYLAWCKAQACRGMQRLQGSQRE